MEKKKNRSDKKITIIDIARRLGISPATVSNALTGERYVKKETIEKVKKMVEELDYRPNIIARALRSKKRNIVGLLTSNINNPFYAEIISGVEEVMSRNDYILVINSTRFDKDIEIKAVKQLMNLLIDGLIFLGGSCDFSHIDEIIPPRTPVIFINRKVNRSKYTEINIDYGRAINRITGFLVENGHKKIGYIGWKNDSSIIPNEKYNGYMQALGQYGIKPNNDHIFLKEKTPIRDFREFREYSKEMHPRILELGITAFIAQSDPIALGFMDGLRSKGINIPGDISITGIGNILQSQTSYPTLTTVHIPKIRMGRFGAETLLKLIARGANIKQEIYLKTTLIKRASVRNILLQENG